MESNRLSSLLLNTQLQKTNPPLYQFLRDFIDTIGDIQKNVKTLSASGGSIPITNVTQNIIFDNQTSEADLLPLPIIDTINNPINIISQLLMLGEENNDYSLTIGSQPVVSSPIQNTTFLYPESIISDELMTIPGPIGLTGPQGNPALFGILQSDTESNEPFFMVVPPTLVGVGVINRLSKWIGNFQLGTSIVSDNGTATQINGDNTVTGNEQVVGSLEVDTDFTLFGKSILAATATPTATYDGATKTNDFSPSTAVVLRISPNAAPTGNAQFTGFSGGATGRMICIQNNETAFNIILFLEDAGSAAANRIAGAAGIKTILAGEGMWLVYDGVSSRWRMIN